MVLSCQLCFLILLSHISFSFGVSRQFADPRNAVISMPGCLDLALSFSLFSFRQTCWCSRANECMQVSGLRPILSYLSLLVLLLLWREQFPGESRKEEPNIQS